MPACKQAGRLTQVCSTISSPEDGNSCWGDDDDDVDDVDDGAKC